MKKLIRHVLRKLLGKESHRIVAEETDMEKVMRDTYRFHEEEAEWMINNE